MIGRSKVQTLKLGPDLQQKYVEQGLVAVGETITSQVWIGSIPSSATVEQVQQLFSQFGEITHIRFVAESSCAFVTFASAEAALNSLSLDGFNGFGSSLSLNIGKQRRYLWVGGLDPHCTEEDLTQLFLNCGEVESVRLMPKSNVCYFLFLYHLDLTHVTQSAFINMKDEAGALLAVETFDGTEWRGSTLAVNFQWVQLRSMSKFNKRSHGAGHRQVYVGNIPTGTTSAAVVAALESFGSIESVRCFSERGFAFVCFHSGRHAAAAIASSIDTPIDIDGNVLILQLSHPIKPPRGAANALPVASIHTNSLHDPTNHRLSPSSAPSLSISTTTGSSLLSLSQLQQQQQLLQQLLQQQLIQQHLAQQHQQQLIQHQFLMQLANSSHLQLSPTSPAVTSSNPQLLVAQQQPQLVYSPLQSNRLLQSPYIPMNFSFNANQRPF